MKSMPLRCPCAEKAALSDLADSFICTHEGCPHTKTEMAFPVSNGIPVLVSEERTDTVCVMRMDVQYVERRLARFPRLKKLIAGESRVTQHNCRTFVEEVRRQSATAKVLVIGGAEKGTGTQALWDAPGIEIHSVDVYGSESVDIICDAHHLPLAAEAYHGVWIQAVLEHVVEPQVVVGEIFRVLKQGGIVYAETPFMQQVHEGAYDFTRYTVLGHRYLFKRFEALDFGGNGGPEIAFAWSVRYLVWALSRSRRIARLTGLLIGLLVRPLGALVSRRSLFDASSGVYFLGRKGNGRQLDHRQLVAMYKGMF